MKPIITEEALKAIEFLNEQYYTTTKDVFNIPFSCVVCISAIIDYVEIKFNGMDVWNSENDGRKYIEDKDEFESILDFVKRWYIEYRKSIMKFKL